jgi:lipoprotein-releasing system permease protein
VKNFPTSRFWLPPTWWKLSLLWLVEIKDRSPPLRSRSLFRQSLKTSVLGMAIGVLALSLTLGIVTGFEWTLAKAVNESVGTVTYYTQWRHLDEFRDILKFQSKDVLRAESFWTSQGLVTGPQGGRGILIEGRRTLFENGELVNASPGEGEVWVDVGAELANILGVKTGENLRILLPGLIQGSLEVKVRKLLRFGMYELDSRSLIVDDASLSRYLQQMDPENYEKRPGDAHALRFYLSNNYLSPKTSLQLDEWIFNFAKALKVWPKLNEREPSIKSWREQKKNLFGSIGMDKQVLVVVLSLITLVAALNVAATLVVLYLERDRDLAILKTLGMSHFQLIQWLGLQGLGVGILSVLIGLGASFVLGHFLAQFSILKLPAEVYNLSKLPFHMDLKEQAGVALLGVMACVGVSVFLGWRLARQKSLSVLGFRR